jgi:hypothetical protein
MYCNSMPQSLRNLLIVLLVSCGSSIKSTLHAGLRKEMKLLDTPQDDMDRNLVTLECSDGAGPDNYFTVNIEITPRGEINSGTCSSDLQKSIGATLNVVLEDYGFGKAGEGDKAVFLADVCEVPSLSGRRLARFFSWSGGGVCKSCGADNGDGRMLEASTDSTWFPKTYAPELKKKLEKGIANSLPSSTRACLGSAPSVIVTIHQVATQPHVNCRS